MIFFYVVECQISVRPIVDLNLILWSWGSCCNLGISSHLGTIVSAAAIWNTSHWFHVLTNNAHLVCLNPMCWGVQYCDTLSCCLQSRFSSLHLWVLYPKSEERLGGTWRCCALHHRYLLRVITLVDLYLIYICLFLLPSVFYELVPLLVFVILDPAHISLLMQQLGETRSPLWPIYFTYSVPDSSNFLKIKFVSELC